MAERLSRRKMQHILETGANLVIAANAGCLMQIAREARFQGSAVRVFHPVELLDMSYQRRTLR